MQPLTVRSPASRLALATAAVTLAFGAPTSASAAGCQGAPGTSALEQYCEAIPDATGGRQDPGSRNGSSSGSSANGSGVSKSTANTLSDAGADGAAVQRLAGGSSSGAGGGAAGTSRSKAPGRENGSNADDASAAGAASPSGPDGGGQVNAPADPSNSPLKATTKAVGSGPTVGGALVWGLLGMTALGAIGAVLLRRHNSIESDAGSR